MGLRQPAFSLAIPGPFGHIPPAFRGHGLLKPFSPIPTALDDIPALAEARRLNPNLKKD